MKYKFFLLAGIIVFTLQAQAQKSLFNIGWQVNFPTNTDFLTKASFAGGTIEYRHYLKKNLSVGVNFSWATYEQYQSTQTFVKPDGNSAITTDFVAQVYQLPVLATAHYYFADKKYFKPYVGLGLGTQYLDQAVYYNVYVSDATNWGFAVRPEVGTLIKLNERVGFTLAAYYGFATNKIEALDKSSFSNFGLTLGFALSY